MAGRRKTLDVAGGEPHAPPASVFLRGLTLGALVGAAVAGSLLLGRRRGRDGRQPDATEPTRTTARD